MSEADARSGVPEHVPQVFEAFGMIWEIEEALRPSPDASQRAAAR
jgi:hypothetical protein